MSTLVLNGSPADDENETFLMLVASLALVDSSNPEQGN